MDPLADARAYPALYRISALVGRTEEPREALESILAAIAETFGAGSGSIALVDPDSGRLVIEVQVGLPSDYAEVNLRLGQGITGWVAFHGRAQLVKDVSADTRYVRVRPSVQAEMAVPMIGTGGQILGVINLDSDKVNGFAEADLALMNLLTEEATAVIQRIWQLRHLRGKARQLESLVSIGQALVTKLEPRDLFESVTRDTCQIMQVRACALYLLDAERRTVRLAAYAGDNPAAWPAEEMPIDSCLAAVVIRTRKPVEHSHIQSPEFADLIDLPRDVVLQSVLAVPMLESQAVSGVLAVFTDRPHRFNNDEKRLASALASLATVALQNSRLYARVFRSEESLRKNEQLTTLGLLAAEIAHEIRNPLTVIKLLYGYLNLDFPEGDPRRTDVRLIAEKLDQLEAIVTRVLGFAKGSSSLHSRWNLADIVDDTLLLVRLKLAQGKIQVQSAPPAGPLLVDVHKGQIQQVLLNLIINATQAMPAGGAISVALGTEDRNGAAYATVDISDTGGGIPENIRERVFDSFLSGRPDGTGLGLAIAKRILVSHHGDIQLVATGSTGTTMRITLPIARS
jgi:signal transduction histidine kinase